MQQAAAGANPPEAPWDERMREAAAHPERFTDEQRERLVGQFNTAVQAAANKQTWGARG